MDDHSGHITLTSSSVLVALLWGLVWMGWVGVWWGITWFEPVSIPVGLLGRRTVCVVCRLFFENCTVDASIFIDLIFCGQVTKSTRWMPRHQEPMKDVGGCDKPRGAANQAVIRGCPNGET